MATGDIVSYNLTGNIYWVITVSITKRTLHTPVEKVRLLGIPYLSPAPAPSGSIITEKRSIFVENTPIKGSKHKDLYQRTTSAACMQTCKRNSKLEWPKCTQSISGWCCALLAINYQTYHLHTSCLFLILDECCSFVYCSEVKRKP